MSDNLVKLGGLSPEQRATLSARVLASNDQIFRAIVLDFRDIVTASDASERLLVDAADRGEISHASADSERFDIWQARAEDLKLLLAAAEQYLSRKGQR